MGNVEKYVTVCQIGQGACGAVYLVRATDTKRLYALKKIELDENRKTRTKAAVQQEARILAGLKHPHIVAYHDSFFDDNGQHLSIVQDYCDGGSMEDKINEAIRKKEYLDEEQVIHWFLQIAMAVRYMHSKGVLHRDLKTQNVFLNKAATVCKLGDFGIAKSLKATVDLASTCVGTPCYLSPEICQDLPYSSKADVWALGCILFEMLAQKPAFNASNLVSLFYKIVKGEPDEIPSHYSKQMHHLITTVLQKRPEDRPSARGVLALPYIKKKLLTFIEATEFQLLQQRLPTRNGCRPYSTPTATRGSPILEPCEKTTAADTRTMLCRSAVILRVREPSSVTNAKPNGRVSTIPEETEDQMVDRGLRIEKVIPLHNRLSPVAEATVKPDTNIHTLENITKEDTAHKPTLTVPSEADCESIVTQLVEVKSESDVRVPSRARRLSRDSGSHEGTSSIERESSDGSSSDGSDSGLALAAEDEGQWPGKYSVEQLWECVSLRENGLKKTPSVEGRDGIGMNVNKEVVKQRRLEKAYKSAGGVAGREVNRCGGGANKNGANRVRKPLRPLRMQTPDIRPKKQHPLVVTAKSVSTVAKPKTKQMCDSPRPKGKHLEKKPSVTAMGKTKKMTQRCAGKVRFDLYQQYEADFDDVTSSTNPSDEEIPEEVADCGQSSHATSVICEIEEDLPGGQEADDDDDYVDDFEEEREEIEEELGEILNGAREICDDLDEAEVDDDEVILDDREDRPSTSSIIKRHCLEALGKEKYDKIERYCEDNLSTDVQIRNMETMVGKEHMKTLYLMTAIAKK